VIVTFLHVLLVILTPSQKNMHVHVFVYVSQNVVAWGQTFTYFLCLIVTLYVMPQSATSNWSATLLHAPYFGKIGFAFWFLAD
jgi:hypothetical protein